MHLILMSVICINLYFREALKFLNSQFCETTLWFAVNNLFTHKFTFTQLYSALLIDREDKLDFSALDLH